MKGSDLCEPLTCSNIVSKISGASVSNDATVVVSIISIIYVISVISVISVLVLSVNDLKSRKSVSVEQIIDQILDSRDAASS